MVCFIFLPPWSRGLSQQAVDTYVERPRVVIVTDIGNEPDDQMSMVRLLLYSNEFDLEALVASTSVWQASTTHPETIHKLLDAYDEVRPKLMLNAQGWPTAEDLHAKVFLGQGSYGMSATGSGKATPGSEALVHAILKKDDRPLWICLWGGANTLAQALIDLRSQVSTADMNALTKKLRVYAISDQDDAGSWIRREFKDVTYIVSPSTQDSQEYAAATWTGISGDIFYRNGEGADTRVVTNEWLDLNIRSKGPLGAMYPKFLFIMEGDTPSFLGLVNNGLASSSRPDFGGWGGRYVYRQPRGESHPIWTQGGDEFTRVTSRDSVQGNDGRAHVSDQATIWRWRDAYQNDFAARMQWTIADFAHSNHAPDLVVNGKPGSQVVRIVAQVGHTVTLDAKGSRDPDGQHLRYRWWSYSEAGLDGGRGAVVSIKDADAEKATVSVDASCSNAWFPVPCRNPSTAHVILEVSDDGSPSLTSYRRIIITVPSPLQK